MREFAFDVTTISKVLVRAEGDRAARDALQALLDRSTARIVEGSGIGLALTRLRVLGSAKLVSIDGEDPFASVEAALRALRGSTDRRSPETGDQRDPEVRSTVSSR